MAGIIAMYEICNNTKIVAPTRVLYSFSRLRSVCCIKSQPYFIVAGCADGELLLYDLRQKGGNAPRDVKGLPCVADERIVWQAPTFSTGSQVYVLIFFMTKMKTKYTFLNFVIGSNKTDC